MALEAAGLAVKGVGPGSWTGPTTLLFIELYTTTVILKKLLRLPPARPMYEIAPPKCSPNMNQCKSDGLVVEGFPALPRRTSMATNSYDSISSSSINSATE